MAGESCNLDKDEAEIFKSSSSPSASPPPPPPPASPPSPPPTSVLPKSCEDSPIHRSESPAPKKPIAASSTPILDEESSKPGEESQPPVRFSNRCSACHRKVGLTGFRCRCGDLFCGRHRYSDAHDCSFDYKAFGREEIARANPLIKAAKIIKI
ncbi:zinc finger AN1 domain-containing stress-associated protein 15-like [Zingiber officinale]|uniref:AN1-type domain-containing protein n=1 Tax=Zingiber officinale TaxID=94328 RepID=A0A8J5HXH5_ZINOF|nr:zinc finger AN1 domain-containing stress-associated protein 15-like [Zingiber officinale]XP_042430907.1 zinc finger AN1 domain-containing stress-associated protein 15-like [Zingiber officinale]XP_042430915.1 zinc finger AN1 domain-containing stress-associated protein 15-like [Zingiber officinale]XP_042430923.1 zinc finger AN1 domain-containing stress-associated protein 15-like [Zingiber officinale]XP_042430932.1 zinc finger AN1 domain-containing stress-associated protein 15-like [Zingiber of